MTGLIGTIQQLETANATPDPAIWSKSLSGLGTSDRDQTYNLGNLSTYIGGIVFKDDGTVFVAGSMAGTLDDFIIEYQASTAFTINSGVTVSSSSSNNLDVNPPQGLIGGVSVAGGGTRVYSFGRSTSNVNCFHLSTAWDLGTGGSAQSNLNTSTKISNVYGGHVKDDGTEVYVVGYSPSSGSADKIYQYSLSTAHDLSTASFTGEFDYSSKVPVAGGVHFESNGDAFVVVDISSDKMHKYNLSTSWDITTASFHSSSDALTSDAATLSGVWFDDDWSYIYYADQGNDDLFRIPLLDLPAAPSGLSATTASTSQINLSWNSVSGTGTVTYTVQRSTSSGSGFSNVATGLTGTTYNNTGLSQGTRYYYRVQAVDDNGAGSYSSEANRFTLPGQVTGLSATAASSSQINLSWNNPSGTETGFQVYRSTSSNMSGQTLLATPTGTTYSATGLSASTTYYFRVRAVNSGGNGAYSSIVNATTQAASANPPTNVSIATTSSGNYNNALEIENIAIGSLGQNPVTDEDGSNFSSNAVTVDLTYSPDYEAALNNNNGRLELKCFGYIRATGATSFQWDISNLSVNTDTFSAVNSISTVGTASTSQDATTFGVGEVVRIQHNSGGRGYLMLANSGDNISFDVDADATNSDGTTSASTLTVTLETV